MTNDEKVMYKLIAEISKTEAPIVFKGALITKLVLAESGFSELERPTVDIDANWIGSPPTMDDLKNTINRSLELFDGEFKAIVSRVFGEGKSAGLSIIETATGIKKMKMDIAIEPVTGSRVYYYGKAAIKGVLPNEILADKITVLSGKYIFRRAKDVIDTYALSHCVDVQTIDIFDDLKGRNRELGKFVEFYTQRDDVEHSYNKLKGVTGKPPFDDVYSYLNKFIHPFAQKDKTAKIWNSKKAEWDDVSSRTKDKPSILAHIKSHNEKAAKNKFKPSKRKNEPEH